MLNYKNVTLIGIVPTKTVHAMVYSPNSTSIVGYVLASQTVCGAVSGDRGTGWQIVDAKVNCWKCARDIRKEKVMNPVRNYLPKKAEKVGIQGRIKKELADEIRKLMGEKHVSWSKIMTACFTKVLEEGNRKNEK